ncbi:MAG TPA: glycosyltransferase [Planctomycetaceae bacterium]|jgi:glycosyltransferase involved in cell wall biosynthesis
MSTERLIIHAPNVHTGGGRVLLTELLASLSPYTRGAAILDRRLLPPRNLPPAIAVRQIAPSPWARLWAERHLARISDEHSRILCFGNLPPLVRCRGRVSVFLHNRHLVSATDLSGFSLKARLRILAERVWIRRYAARVDEWIVQTESMQLLLTKILGNADKIRVLPFVSAATVAAESSTVDISTAEVLQPVDFCYVASGEPHKNHRRLIEAWVLLARQGQTPSLRITLDHYEDWELCQWIDQQVRQFDLRVDNVGRVAPERIANVYRSSRSLIHPSWCESFGLPLVEARSYGLPIVAAELDYVRDVVVPQETFDPHSPRSIARAVGRHLGRRDAVQSLQDGKAFLEQLAVTHGRALPSARRTETVRLPDAAGRSAAGESREPDEQDPAEFVSAPPT